LKPLQHTPALQKNGHFCYLCFSKKWNEVVSIMKTTFEFHEEVGKRNGFVSASISPRHTSNERIL
jgi:hypothetical protein